jgi:hypothetical protein
MDRHDEATLYVSGLLGYERIEASRVYWQPGPYGEHDNATEVFFVPRGKRSERMVRIMNHPKVVILKGWGHPAAPAAFGEGEERGGFLAFSAKHTMGSQEWSKEFDEFLADHVKQSKAVILADFRKAKRKATKPHSRPKKKS